MYTETGSGSPRTNYHMWLLVTVLLFAVVQLTVIGIEINGPHIDESIYMLSGQEIRAGDLESGGSMTWFAGSPLLWPVISSIGYDLAGLFGARLMAALVLTLGLYGFGRFAFHLVGSKAGWLAVVLFALFGPVLHLAHFSVYDVGALAALCWAAWMIAAFARYQHRWLLIAAGFLLALMVLFKYPIVLMVPTMFVLLIVLLRFRNDTTLRSATADMAVMAIAFLTPLLIYISVYWNAGLSDWWAWATTHRSSFLATRWGMVSDFVLVTLIPIFLSVITIPILSRKLREYAILAYATALLWPAYHLITLNGSADQKHIIFSVILLYPLFGYALKEVDKHFSWGKLAVGVTIVIVALYGIAQMIRYDRSWTDSRPIAEYLVRVVDPDDEILIADSWSVLPYLLRADAVYSRFQVNDLWVVENRPEYDPCATTDYVVDIVQSTYTYPEGYMDRLRDCGFEAVFETTTWITPGSRWGQAYEMTAVVYAKERPVQEPAG